MSINSVKNDSIGQDSVVNAQKPIAPTITNYSVDGVDDEALDPAGGQTVLINGSGFQRGATVTFDGAAIAVVSWVSSSQLSFTAPAKSAGTYNIYVVNSDGGTAIYIPGIIYSTFPTWTTAQGTLGSYYETQSISNSVVATGDAPITYSVVSGSLPSGATLASDGTITGTSPVESGSTTYSFTVQADDAELQSSTRSFSLTINTDVVTWVTPSSGATINLDGTAYSQALSATDAAGYSVSYSANALPTGLTLSSGTISGTPTTEGTSSTLLTATAATTNRTGTNTITWVVSLSDAYWKYATLLLTANSSIQTSSFVSDNSINNAQLTVFGDTKVSNFNPYQQGYYSNYFNGTSSQWISFSAGAGTSGDLGTGDFTLECWTYLYSRTSLYPMIFDNAGANGNTNRLFLTAGHSSGTTTKYNCYASSSLTTFSSDIIYNKWTHIALVRTGTTIKLYVNGVADATTLTSSQNLTGTTNSYIGGSGADAANCSLNGLVSNFRIVKGTALYTTNFTPSSTPLTNVSGTTLLTCNSSRFLDNSNLTTTITVSGTATAVSGAHPFSTVYQAGTQYYSTKFDGTGDYLTVPNSSNFAFGTGDFTIEYWMFANIVTGSTNGNIVGYSAAGAGHWNVMMYLGNLYWQTGQGVSNLFNVSIVPYSNKWTHYAFVRSSGTTKLYIDGVQQATGSDSTSYTVPTATLMYIGYNSELGYLNGNISNLRIVKGTALYTSNFTPSTTPLTSVSGTSLLTCQDSTFKDNSSNNLTITSNGDTKPVAVSPFTPSSYTNTQITTYGSGYFDGTGDSIACTNTPNMAPGTGDFTYEAWVYTSTFTYTGTTGKLYTTAVSNGLGIDVTSSGAVAVSKTAVATLMTTTTSLTLNAWNHVAVSRISGSTRVFINGVLAHTAAVSDTNDYSAYSAVFIGQENNSRYFNGYLSDVRFIKGTALYTSNFVPQFTSTLTNVTNTQLLTLQSNGVHNNSTFKDSSMLNSILTRSGNTTNGTFSPYGDNWSVYTIERSYLSVPTSSSFDLINTDFTIEFWFNPISFNTMGGSASNLFGNGLSTATGGWGLTFDGSSSTVTSITYQVYNGGWQTNVFTVSIQLNTWAHVALVRNGSGAGNLSLYVNGILQGSAQNQKTYSAAGGTFTLGSGAYTQNGTYSGNAGLYLSNVRITKSVVYSAPFTVSSSPLTNLANTVLLMCQSPRFVNNAIPNAVVSSSTHSSTYAQTQKFSPFSTVTVPKYYSTYFDGTGDSLTLTATGSTFGTGDFTIECWIYRTSSASDESIFVQGVGGTGGYGLAVYSQRIRVRTPSIQDNSKLSTATISQGSWYHIALSRSGTTTRFYINGTLDLTITSDSSNETVTAWNIGHYGASDYVFSGYISNLRVVKGTALYTTNFTPSTTLLTAVSGTVLLTCQDNTFKDNSTNNFTVTASGDAKPLPVSPFTPTSSSPTSYSPAVFGGSMYFDGTTDMVYRQFSSPAPYIITGDFTVQAWVYPTGTEGSYIFIYSSQKTAYTADIGIMLKRNGGLIIIAAGSGSGTSYTASFPGSASITQNTWNHIALVRKSNTLYAYLNGIRGTGVSASGTIAPYLNRGDLSGPLGFYVGTTDANWTAFTPTYYAGYITDLIFDPSSALYSDNFYPGPTPITPTVNSLLGLNGISGGVVDATRTVDLETVADAKVTSFSPYNGSYYSNYFDGTGDYLSIPNNIAFDFGTSDFTIEGWFMLTSDAAANGDGTRDATLFSFFPPNGGSLYNDYNLSLVGNTTTTGTGIGFGSRYNNSTPKAVNYIGTISKNVWHHFAFCKTGTTGSMYYDGNRVAQGTVYSDVNSGGYEGRIGSLSTFGSNNYLSYFPGYISNIRVVKGSQVYTGATYTVPTSPLTPVSGTSLLTCQSNKFVDNSTNNFTITRNGDVKVATQNPFQVNTGQSYYFDGTGDYLTFVSGQNVAFGTGDFTVEFWCYVIGNTSTSAAMIVDTRNASQTSTWVIGIGMASADGKYGWWNGSAAPVTDTTVAASNVWTHVAVTRTGTAMKLYINGSLVASGTDSTNYTTAPTISYIGGRYNQTNYLNGYISDLRITKGYARTITVPTTPYKLN